MQATTFFLSSALALSAAASAAQAQVIFFDGGFNTGPYTSSSQTFGSVTVTPSTCLLCGPTGSTALRVRAEYTGEGRFNVAYLVDGFVYTPSVQGGVASINAQIDKNLSTNPPVVSFGNSFRPLILQNGQLFAAVVPGPSLINGSTTGWNTLAASALQASDFVSYSTAAGSFGVANPDFNGAPMTFGLLQTGSLVGPGELEFLADYANFRLVVTAVPEPQTAGLFIAGLLGLWAVGWRRRAAAA